MKKILILLLLIISTFGYSQIIYTPYKKSHIKITIRTMANNNIEPSEITEHDIVNVAAYDIRVKLYLTKNISIIDRTVVTGINTTTYYYSVGIIYKFK